jgi:hypothetical protein
LQRLGDATGARWEHLEAQQLEDAARAVLKAPEMAPTAASSGERAAYTYPDPNDHALGRHLRDTLRNPEMTAVQAALERVRLLMDLDCLELAQDLADTIGTRDSIERLMAGQLAATHAMALRFLALSQKAASHAAEPGEPYWREHNVEACRLGNVAARLMSSFHEAVLTLGKLRSGGTQNILVQHVRVQDGGQAVIAGGGLSTTGGHAENGGTTPCQGTSPTPEPLHAAAPKRAKRRRASKPQYEANGAANSMGGAVQEDPEGTSTP